MKRFLSSLVAACAAMVALTGCYSTIDGHNHAGVPFSKDKIDSRYERPVDQVFAAAKEVLKFNGSLEGENTITKVLWAKVDTRTVFVKVEEAEPKVTAVTVQVRRKGGSSDIYLASEIDKQIALRLINR